MITLRLRLGGSETVLTLPEREGRPDALDVLEAAIARVDGRPWEALLAAPSAEGGVVTPTPAPERAPSASNAVLAPLAGASDPPETGVRATSRDAYDRLKAGPRLTRQQAALVAHLRKHPDRDWTRAELAQAIGWRINVICGRVNELLQGPFAALEEVARRRCAVTGESAMALRLK